MATVLRIGDDRVPDPKLDGYITASKAQETSQKRRWEEHKLCSKRYSLDWTWLLLSLAHCSCGYLDKTCTKFGSAAFFIDGERAVSQHLPEGGV